MLMYIYDIFLSKHTFFAVCVIMTERLHDIFYMYSTYVRTYVVSFVS